MLCACIVRHRADYLYVLPALGVMLLVIAYPVYYTIYLSFFNTPPNLAIEDKIFVGLDNYARILRSESFHEATWNTFVWTLFSTFFAFVSGFGAALALNREFVGRGVLRGMLLVPYVISAVAAAYVWRWLYHSDFGVIGAMLVAARPHRPADQLPRQSLAGDAVADRGQRLEGIPVRDDHDAGRTADGARPAAAGRAGRRRQRLAALLARHDAASAKASRWSPCCCCW